jgi:oxygen-independent coproporphyrinogen III oxidase
VSELEDTSRVPLEPKRGTPLYVHLPFCVTKCSYCDFFSVPADGQDVEGWLDNVIQEAQHRAPSHPSTVFFGGGTPSLLSRAQLTKLLDALDRITSFRASAKEVTAECNPESLDPDKARCLVDLGVRRLSIGFQSLRSEVLALFGRVHSVEQSFRAYEAAREAGARDVSIDMIYAVPGQRPEEWAQDLDRVIALGPDHFSAYNLAFEEGTPFRRWLEEGTLQRLPEETELEMFRHTRARLAANGLHGYEISNYSRTGHHCEHNVNYWRNGDYLGIGPSAVSKVGATRQGNVRSILDYRRRISARRHALAWSETPSWGTRLGETWWLGLRLAEGLTPAQAWGRSGRSEWTSDRDPAVPVAERLRDEGWLDVDREGRWRLSEAGLPLADAVAREFLRLGAEAATELETRTGGRPADKKPSGTLG